ncbi:MAG TPA: hypothetical protein VFA37_09210 [Gaiellaceae bacterium]|nr:hypothetical protein [Gaiellaceae bacterium]
MSKTLLTVATRKGTFLLESDDRKNWTLSEPLCEGWPIYHAIYDATSDSIYAAAASEWHGSCIWRSRDRGSTWEMSSEGLSYPDDDGRKVNKVATLARAGDRLLVGVEAPGIFESKDDGATWSLLSTLSGQHGSEYWDDPANQAPGHLGISGFVTDPDDSDNFFAIVQGVGAFETDDGGSSWTPRNQGLRRDWPGDYEDVGFCVHKLVRSSNPERMYQQNHVGVHRSDDAGQSWTEITEGLPGDFGFAAAVHPHDTETFYVIPVDGGHGRTMHDGKATVWRTRDAGSSWEPLRNGLPQVDAHLGVLRQGMTMDTHDVPGIYFGTSTGQVFASADEGETWTEIASYLPSISSVDVAIVD